MNDASLSHQLAEWRRRRPELALVVPYLDPAQRDALVAWSAIAGQWQDDVDDIAETQVLEAKFAWWAEELALARRGQPRHPLSGALFTLEAARGLPERAWLAPIEAGLARRDAPPVADFAAQMRAFEPLQNALATLETALWFGTGADTTRAARLATLAHMLAVLPRLGPASTADSLPMNLIARHALDRAALGVDTPARDAAVRDQLDALQSAWADAMSLSGPLSLFASAGMRFDRKRLHHARRSKRPLAALAGGMRPGFSLAWQAWRDARRLQRNTR